MRLLLVAVLCLSLQISNGQEKSNFEKIDIETMYQIESDNESVFIDTVEFSLTLDNFSSSAQTKTKTYIFKRIHDDFTPKLHVWYHVDQKSNNIVAITYNWDFYNPSFNPDKNRELIFETIKRESEYQRKYQDINSVLKGIFTNPSKTNLINDSDYSFNEMTYWENSKLYAYSRLRFQRKIDENPMIGLANNHFVVQMVVSYK
ncbi:MAG: hypothetical protein ACJAUJ_001322 [Salibacteraceae bacterium]|jgi:hypothetical protein